MLSIFKVCFIMIDFGFLIKIGFIFVDIVIIDVNELLFGNNFCLVGMVIFLFVEINVVLLCIVRYVFVNFLYVML